MQIQQFLCQLQLQLCHPFLLWMNLNFKLTGYACPIWWDNGGPDRNASTAERYAR